MEPPNQLILTPLQRSLHDALAIKGSVISSMYLGALHALISSGNPERFSQAAQSLRELIHHLWLEYDPLRQKKDVGLNGKAKILGTVYLKVRQQNGQIVKASQIPVADIEKVFIQLDELFAWMARVLPTRSEQAARVISNMDPMIGTLPATFRAAHVKEFQTLREYFEGVAHHNFQPESDSEFQSRVARLENFLLALLRPQTSQNFAEIEKLIREGDANA
jgi:hypothetical protein